MDPNTKRSAKARDKTCSGLATAIKAIKIGEKSVDELHILVVSNKSYKDRRRPGNLGPNDPGKPKGVGLPTGGSEAQEDLEHVARRETYFETGYPVNRVIRNMQEFAIEKKCRGGSPSVTHPHFLFLMDVDSDYVTDIRERDEITWSTWMSFSEIVERLKLSKKAKDAGSINPEAFYYSHAKNFIIPIFLRVYYMTPEEIAVEENHYQTWLRRFQPYIIDAIDKHADELMDLNLMSWNEVGEDKPVEISDGELNFLYDCSHE